MRFYADESLHAELVDALRNEGFQVDYVAEQFPSIDDDAILALALSQDAILNHR